MYDAKNKNLSLKYGFCCNGLYYGVVSNIYRFNSEKQSRSTIHFFFTHCRLLTKSLHFLQICEDKVMPYDNICANNIHHEWKGYAKLRDKSQNRRSR